MTALARVIAEQLQGTVQQIGKNIIYARIDELDEQTLDVLAYDLHVDWYDYSYPIEVKRQTIRDSVRVHRRLGTKYAVETALGAVFPGTRVQEWFEYGGEPYMFKVIIGATESGVSADRQAAVLERVRFYKNLRSHLEAISYQIEKKRQYSRRRSIPSACDWKFTPILRRTSRKRRASRPERATPSACAWTFTRMFTGRWGADWRALCAAYIQQTGKLEIFPQNRTEA